MQAAAAPVLLLAEVVERGRQIIETATIDEEAVTTEEVGVEVALEVLAERTKSGIENQEEVIVQASAALVEVQEQVFCPHLQSLEDRDQALLKKVKSPRHPYRQVDPHQNDDRIPHLVRPRHFALGDLLRLRADGTIGIGTG